MVLLMQVTITSKNSSSSWTVPFRGAANVKHQRDTHGVSANMQGTLTCPVMKELTWKRCRGLCSRWWSDRGRRGWANYARESIAKQSPNNHQRIQMHVCHHHLHGEDNDDHSALSAVRIKYNTSHMPSTPQQNWFHLTRLSIQPFCDPISLLSKETYPFPSHTSPFASLLLPLPSSTPTQFACFSDFFK